MLDLWVNFNFTCLFAELLVSDIEVRCCLEPTGNRVNPGRGDEGGPGPPSGEQVKQLTASRGGDNRIMGGKKTRRRVRRDKEDPSCTE
jgi:hypothetical protein